MISILGTAEREEILATPSERMKGTGGDMFGGTVMVNYGYGFYSVRGPGYLLTAYPWYTMH